MELEVTTSNEIRHKWEDIYCMFSLILESEKEKRPYGNNGLPEKGKGISEEEEVR